MKTKLDESVKTKTLTEKDKSELDTKYKRVEELSILMKSQLKNISSLGLEDYKKIDSKLMQAKMKEK